MTKIMKKDIAQMSFSLAAALLMSTAAFADDFEGAPMEAGAIAMEMDAGAPMPMDGDEPMPSETIDNEVGAVINEDTTIVPNDEQSGLVHGQHHELIFIGYPVDNEVGAMINEDPTVAPNDEQSGLVHGQHHELIFIGYPVDSEISRSATLPTDAANKSSSSSSALDTVAATLAFEQCLAANVAEVEICAPLNPNLSN